MFVKSVLQDLVFLFLFCSFLCVGLLVLAGTTWVLGAIGAGAAGLLVFGVGLIINISVSFVAAARLAAWLVRERARF